MYSYAPSKVCARRIDIELDDEGRTVRSVEFQGGCNGNLKAIAKLVAGRPVDEVTAILEGNECGNRGTSCADQLCDALREAQKSALAANA